MAMSRPRQTLRRKSRNYAKSTRAEIAPNTQHYTMTQTSIKSNSWPTQSPGAFFPGSPAAGARRTQQEPGGSRRRASWSQEEHAELGGARTSHEDPGRWEEPGVKARKVGGARRRQRNREARRSQARLKTRVIRLDQFSVRSRS